VSELSHWLQLSTFSIEYRLGITFGERPVWRCLPQSPSYASKEKPKFTNRFDRKHKTHSLGLKPLLYASSTFCIRIQRSQQKRKPRLCSKSKSLFRNIGWNFLLPKLKPQANNLRILLVLLNILMNNSVGMPCIPTQSPGNTCHAEDPENLQSWKKDHLAQQFPRPDHPVAVSLNHEQR
jgi:hypothetical protein